MNEKTHPKKITTLSDKELFEYILGSLELVQAYLKNYNLKKFENDIMIQDAVCNRMHNIGRAACDLSKEILTKYSGFPWMFYTYWNFDSDTEIIWYLAKGKHKGDFESIQSYFEKIENIYFREYFPTKIDSSNMTTQNDIPWSTDYQYPIKSNKSLWTVKNK